MSWVPKAGQGLGDLAVGLRKRWSRGGLFGRTRLGELGIWLAAFMACAVGSKQRPTSQIKTSALGYALDQEGCVNLGKGLLARWEKSSSKCGPLLVQDSRYPRRVGLLAGESGSTLAEGVSPSACVGGACDFLSWNTKLGPVVVAALHPGSPDNPAQYWLGLRNGHFFSFISLTPSDAQTQAGEVVGPSVMLEPYKCGSHLALRREAKAKGERAKELAEREGRYVPDGQGWLVVPDVDWDTENCERLPLVF